MSRECPVSARARTDGARPALSFEGRTVSYAALDAQVEGWRAWLEARGVGRGGRVGVLAGNGPEVHALFFAAGRLGASLLPFNARLERRELEPLAERARVDVRLAEPGLEGRLPGAWPFPRVEAAIARGPALIDEEAVAAHLFTSGTTATPRLVPLLHRNFQASAAASGKNLGADAGQVWLGTLPLFHVGGLAMAHRCAVYGATLWLERTFEAQRAAALLAVGSVTHASLVPTTLARVLAAGAGPFSPRLEAVLVGGGPMHGALLGRARAAGLPVLQTWGLTEACSQVATERRAEADGETAGRPLDGVEVRVVDPDGRPVGPGVTGELEVRGPTVSPGGGGWLATKDLGGVDARGRVSIWSRRDDLIVSGGENVAPAEIEQVLAGHRDVRDVAVVPVEDATWGQVPVAVVVAASGLSAATLDAFAREALAPFKRPRRYLFVDELPRNAGGKLDRLRARTLAEPPGSVEVPPLRPMSSTA